MRLRDYTPEDKAACLVIFDSNAAPYFALHERGELINFLDNLPAPYFVVEGEDGAVAACGGYWIVPQTPVAHLTWGMVARGWHRQGIGRLLLHARLQRLRQEPGLETVRLQTSQYTYGFFEKEGFVIESIEQDGFAAGLHRYNMTLDLDAWNPT